MPKYLESSHRIKVRPRIPTAPMIPMTKVPVATGAPPVEVEVVGILDVVAVDPDPAEPSVVDGDNEVTDEMAVVAVR